MISPLSPGVAATFHAPIVEAHRWLAETARPEGLALLNLSQAAPVEPPPLPLRQAMAAAVMEDPGAHLYGPDLGLPELREALAARTARLYGGTIAAEQVAITAGCNHAFTLVAATLAGPGDEVILPVPWYFNHKMWLDTAGARAVPLPTGDTLVPDPQAARALITPRTRAIVLVTPNNPAGAEYPAEVLRDFLDLARRHGIALIVDETYRDFHARPGAPHDLFSGGWDDTLIHLYSFSKAYRLTGHRVGAILASPSRLVEVEKVMDSTVICAPQLGQRAALWGLRNLDQWLADERDEILARRAAVTAGFAELEGWRLKGAGAYFAYVEHPFALDAEELTRRLLARAAILPLPATMFLPRADASGPRHLRLAFANADAAGLATLFERLAAFRP